MKWFKKAERSLLRGIKKMLIFALILIGAYAVISGALFAYRFHVGKALAAETKPFSQEVPGATKRILFLGDSTAVGVGATAQEKTIPGLFAKDFPKLTIENKGVSGTRLHGLRTRLESDEFAGQSYDLVVLQIGGNDVVHFSDSEVYKEDINAMLELSKKLSENVVVLHGGDITGVPIFPWPTNYIYLGSSEKLRTKYLEACEKTGVIYVDIYTAEKRDPRSQSRDIWFARDAFHPSDMAYKVWYEQIRLALDKNNIVL